jgi:signal transduction histidine kinase
MPSPGPAVTVAGSLPFPPMKNLIGRLSLAQQYLLVSFPILLAATLVIGWWIGLQVEDSVVRRIGGVTALYVDSFVSPHVQTLVRSDDLTPADRAELSALLANTALGKKIVSLKIWRPDGRVLFSSDDKDTGKTFPIDEGLAIALAGGIYSEISDRSDEERAEHGAPMPRLIETYTPIHADRLGKVIASAEFYSGTDEVDREASVAQARSWLLVAATMLGAYLLLFLIVRRGSRKIIEQQHDLSEKVLQLTHLNEQNTQLHERVRRAAERATSLNETFLQRISADIHDGPGQDLGFALMQLKNIGDTCAGSGDSDREAHAENLLPVRLAVESALGDMCAISADLQLPDIEPLEVRDLLRRVIRDYETKTGCTVSLQTDVADAHPSLRVKITLYRLLQEALANTFRHAKCKKPHVHVTGDATSLAMEVSDDGPGFDTEAALKKGRLGLNGMRQRAEVLGGTFELQSRSGVGTLIRVTLPLSAGWASDD